MSPFDRDAQRTHVQAAKLASRVLARASSEQKNATLLFLADLLEASSEQIFEANAKDIVFATEAGLSLAMIDRLRLNDARLQSLMDSVRQIASLADPVGRTRSMQTPSNGLLLEKMQVPLGLIAIVYESRPNVTIDAAALCLKSGNACVLRGGKEAQHTNQVFADLIARALANAGLPREAVYWIPTPDRELLVELMKMDDLIDVLIPRGGDALMNFVSEHARIPVIRHHKGVCHIYVHEDADLDRAVEIVVNAKTQRPGVCNALETLLIDRECAERFLPAVARALVEKGVELRADAKAKDILDAANLSCVSAAETDWSSEYLDLILAMRVVDGYDEARAHIEQFGSGHTEAILTTDLALGDQFLREVDASLVLVNASTRFNDGSELGLGAEMGISTTKLHAYGPMGLSELCTEKWIARGRGQIRS